MFFVYTDEYKLERFNQRRHRNANWRDRQWQEKRGNPQASARRGVELSLKAGFDVCVSFELGGFITTLNTDHQ
jgi:hypothetical protein